MAQVVGTHRYAKALLKSAPQGACAYIDADLRDPETILAKAAETLDFTRPVAVMLISVLQVVSDDDEARAIIKRLTGACVPGSFVTIAHPASDIDAEQMAEMARRLNQFVAEKSTHRTRACVARLFDGLELTEPGLVRVAEWRPDSELEAATPTVLWGGVARKA